MSSQIFDIAKQMFRKSRIHNCDNPNCCLKAMLNELDLEDSLGVPAQDRIEKKPSSTEVFSLVKQP